MFAPYQPRPLAFLGVESVAGYLLKVYTIRHDVSRAFKRERFADRWEVAGGELPQPAVADRRPGVGFAILHQAQGDDYLIMGWWDRQNELPTRVFLRGEQGWRAAQGGESFCVWDLRVMWWEREAYVGTVLAGSRNAVGAYLAMVIEGFA